MSLTPRLDLSDLFLSSLNVISAFYTKRVTLKILLVQVVINKIIYIIIYKLDIIVVQVSLVGNH